MNPELTQLPPGHLLYSHSIRSDILPLIDRKYSNVLDVGCSSGNTGVMLKEHGLCNHVIGIEPFEATAKIAKKRLDRVRLKRQLAIFPTHHSIVFFALMF